MPRPNRKKGRSRDLKKVLEIVGTDAELARLLGISRQAVGKWKSIPSRRVSKTREIVRA